MSYLSEYESYRLETDVKIFLGSILAPGDKYAKSESCRVHVLMTSRGMKESVL